MDIVSRLREAIHRESAWLAPQTSELIEAAKAAIEEIERLRDKLRGEIAAQREADWKP